MASSELVTMLNPRTMSFSVRSGGAPTFTAEDVNHALSYVTELTKLGAALLHHMHTEVLSRFENVSTVNLSAEQMLADLMQAERVRRMHEEHKTRVAYQIAKENYAATRSSSQQQERVLSKLRASHINAKDALWPSRGDDIEKIYIGIRRTILDDLKNGRVCKKCNGARRVISDECLIVDCNECDGTGIRKSSLHKLAKNVGRHKNSVNDTWYDVYNYTYKIVRNELSKAQKKFEEVTK
jgi:hypothetical protein